MPPRGPGNPQHTQMREWIADTFGPEARFNPEAFSLNIINESLQQLAKCQTHRRLSRP